MNVQTFIRIDKIGHWRGTEHVSSEQGVGDDIEFYNAQGAHLYFENGISCYELDAEGLAELYHYWIKTASMDEADALQSQVTIFKGKFNGFGSENEIVASCIETVKEFPAITFYEKWVEFESRWFDDDETDADNTKEYIEQYAHEFFQLIDDN